MRRIQLWWVIVLGPGWSACVSLNTSKWAREGAVAASKCVLPADGEVTEQSRRACVSMARILEPALPDLSLDALRAGPPSVRPFTSDETVYCRFIPRQDDGGSLKFRCMRADSVNRLYDDEDRLVPDAATWDDDGGLLDAERQPIVDEGGKRRRGDELRVKYFLGQVSSARHREMFTETVTSHLFWALGIPVDRVYMPASIRCFGCGPDPFTQSIPATGREPQVFEFASVERRYEGEQINVVGRRGWLGLGGRYGHGFAFDEIEGLAASGSSDRRTDTEVLVTALSIVGFNRPSSYQNELVCRAGRWNRETGVCTESAAYVQDVGGTFGGSRARTLPGLPKSEMRKHPRGDWPTYSQERVFKDRRTCTLTYEIADVRQLTEAGRHAMAQRIQGRIGHEELSLIFRKANVHRMDPHVVAHASRESGISAGPELDRHVQRMWASALHGRLKEVLEARCPER